MTHHRDPIGDRPVPVGRRDPRVLELGPLAIDALDDATLLAVFAGTVARYLDAPAVTVGWGDRSWRAVTVELDWDAPFGDLVAGVAAALATGAADPRVPSFGVAPGPAPDGRGPALLALERGGRVTYAADAYDEHQVRRFVAHLEALAAARDTAEPLGRLPLVSAAERDVLAPGELPVAEATTLVDLIGAQVAATPDVVAVQAGGRSLTFAELWSASGRVAAALPVGGLVGVWAARSVDLMVGLVGVVRAGSAYVALEPSYPSARLRTVADLAGLTHVVAGSDVDRDAIAALGLSVLRVDPTGPGPARPAEPRVAASDLAYVMFTSGSTGVPKGVMLEHRNVVNTLRHMALDPGLRAGEVMLGVTTPAFDLSVPDLFLPLVTGATLVLADGDTHRDGAALARLIDEVRPDLMQATPSTWRLLCESGWSGAPGMRVVCGGEAYDAALLRVLAPRVAGVWNFYGPTETCVWSVSRRLTGLEDDPLPMGTSMRGVACYLLDSRGEPTPPGVRGEIAIAGHGVARGYLGRPDLTDAAFVPCPFPAATLPGRPAGRMYLTGDLGRVGPDGQLRFAGRRDHQIKLNGFRVELGEIEAVVGGLPGVAQAVAVVREDDGLKRIVCYVVSTVVGGAGSGPGDLRAAAAELLPPQSVPAVIVVLDALPLTPNGKVDRAMLPAPAAREGVPLNGEFEELVAAAYAEALSVPVRYGDDNAFTLGADSLLVGRIAIRLTSDLGVDVAPGLVFRNPTVSELAEALLGLLVGEETDLLDELSAS